MVAKFAAGGEPPPDDKEFVFDVNPEELRRRVDASPIVPRFAW